jgi:hypothetical protein
MRGDDERNVQSRFGQLKREMKFPVCVPRIPLTEEHTMRELLAPPDERQVRDPQEVGI